MAKLKLRRGGLAQAPSKPPEQPQERPAPAPEGVRFIPADTFTSGGYVPQQTQEGRDGEYRNYAPLSKLRSFINECIATVVVLVVAGAAIIYFST